jgi:tRNA(Ile)-lysidine synthase
VLRQAIAAFHPTQTLRDVDFQTIERALRFVKGKASASSSSGGQVDLVQGLRLSVEGDRLVISQGELPPDPGWPLLEAEELRLPVPGEVALSSGWRMVSAWVHPQDIPNFTGGQDFPWEAWIDADTLPGELCLRHARPGDRFEPLGMDGHSIKLSDFWINQKLPQRARPAWPLVVAVENIVWVPGYRLAHPFRIRSATRRALYLRIFNE